MQRLSSRIRRRLHLTPWIAATIWLGIAAGSGLAAPEAQEPLFYGGARPLRVGAMPPDLTDNPGSCATCHDAIAREWRGSLHAAAWTSPVFQASYAGEPLEFCRNCHAPTHTGAPPRGRAAHDGISCVTCHVRDGQILGTGKAESPPHPVRAAGIDQSSFCAPCHEFGFHVDGVEVAELQQSTMTEWRARYADGRTQSTCQDCHMQRDALGHRRHDFSIRRDPQLLAAAVEVAVDVRVIDGAYTLSATLTPKGVGHAFPTGDLNRRLELVVWTDDEAQSRRLIYGRSFSDQPIENPTGADTTERRQVSDTRVGQGDATRQLRLDRLQIIPGTRVNWRLDYLLMAHQTARDNGVASATNITQIHAGSVLAP